MNATKLIGLILIVGGVLALAFGGFSYTKDSSAVKVGPVELSVKQKETVNVPLWAGIGAIVAGGLLLVFGRKLPPHFRCAVLPNPSFEARPNGKPPGPGRWYAVHFHRPGPGVLPSSPA